MGIIQSHQEFAVIGETHLYHFGDIRILQGNLENGQCFKQTFEFMVDHSAQEQFISHLKTINNKCPYLVQIKNITARQLNHCSSSSTFDVYFQYIPLNLASLLKSKEKPLTSPQILTVFRCLLESVKHLNQNQSYHGDICPENIYIDHLTKVEPSFKIFDSSYFKPLKNGYYRAQEQKVYLAPQILANLGQKRTFPLYNHHLADTFSIGLVILFCMSLTDPLGAYNYKTYQIDFYYIQSLIRIAERTGYSDNLIGSVRECLKLRNRPTATQILLKYPFITSQQNNLTKSKFSLKRQNSRVHI